MLTGDILHQKFAKRLTERAQESILESFALYQRYPQKGAAGLVTTAHLLYALLQGEGSMAQNALATNGVKKLHLLSYLRGHKTARLSAAGKHTSQPRISTAYKRALKKSASYAMQNGQQYIGTEHLLYGALERIEVNTISPATAKAIRTYLHELIMSASSFDALSRNEPAREGTPPTFLETEDETRHRAHYSPQEDTDDDVRIKTGAKPSKIPTLENFCENLSYRARRHKLDPVVGRLEELQRLIRILSRREKNNPLLVGEPGVGKTALVHALAQRIEAGDVPHNLLNKQIFSLNLTALIAGTMFRGEFEERMRDLVAEASSDNVILVIDEIHTIVGAGSAQGSLDAANIIKPALVNGRFQCIGATTHEEYTKSIEKDGALDRRFQRITVREETPQQSIRTLSQLRPLYEEHHNVRISDDIIKLCVELADKHFPARALPDKALDVLDEAASKVKTDMHSSEGSHYMHTLHRQLERVAQEKDDAMQKEHYNKALVMKRRQDMLNKAIKKFSREPPTKKRVLRVTPHAVYAVVSEMTGVPIRPVQKHEAAALSRLERALNQRVVGQKKAVLTLVRALRRSRAGTTAGNRPVGSFLFMGPSGVGKTELAKTLVEELSNVAPATAEFIKLDMSEFSEAHTVARLIGAPPGYVGHEEAGFLTERIKRAPHAVVLFDEIEKAHPNVWNVLLQILEDGALTDSHGKTASFKNALIILTSNIGSDALKRNVLLGFSPRRGRRGAAPPTKRARAALLATFKPEVINRIDAVVVFDHLGERTLTKIARNQLAILQNRMRDTIAVSYAHSLAGCIARRAADLDKGARGIRTVIADEVEQRIAQSVLARKNRVRISARGTTIQAQ